METVSRPFSGYANGYAFWRDNAASYGIDEAVGICGRYLDMQLKRELHNSERQFCRELFTAMLEANASKTEAPIYPYGYLEAYERGEYSSYHESRERNTECAKEIDGIISNSCYRTNFYNLEVAALIAVLGYGFARVNLVLAFNIQKRRSDGRYSSANRSWVQTFTVPEQAFDGSYLNSHACLVDGFTDYVRKLQS